MVLKDGILSVNNWVKKSEAAKDQLNNADSDGETASVQK